MFAPKRILVPTDFSKFSDAALKKAVDIAAQYQAKVYLLHVITEHVVQCAVDYCIEMAVVQKLQKDIAKYTQDKLKKETVAIAKGTKVNIDFDVREGNPSEIILQEQKDKKIDLIVIASHGKTGLMKQLMGSVADKVVKGAKCPVLVVKR